MGERGGGACGGKAGRGHGEQRLSIIFADLICEDRVAKHRRSDVVHARNVRRRDDGDNTWRGTDGCEVECGDTRMGLRAQADIGMEQRPGLGHVVDVDRFAADMQQCTVMGNRDADAGVHAAAPSPDGT
jgi:hypothetical protein